MSVRAVMGTAELRRGDEPSGPGLLERDGELGEIDATLGAARLGTGRLVLVRGEAGIGKSQLLLAARDRARAEGMLVLGAWGHELERDFPFGVALRMFEPALDALSPAERRLAFGGQAATTACLFEGPAPGRFSDGVDHASSLVHGLRWLVVNLARLSGHEAEGRSALVFLDDAQWSDLSSLRFVAHLSAGIEMLPVTVVVATRSYVDGEASELLSRLANQPKACSLRPAPLSEHATEQLVRAVYPDAVPAFWRACARSSGGNPFYLRSLLEAAEADGLEASDDSAEEVGRLAPESVVRSVILRMAQLPHGAAALAAAVAVLGDGASLHHAGALAGLDGETAELAADALGAGRVLRPGEPLVFVHPLIGTAIYSDLPAMARSRLHRRAAGLVEADGAPVETLAAHLLLSRPDHDQRTVELLVAAARRAAGRGEHHAARRFLERALAEPPAPKARAGLAVELALAEAAAGMPGAIKSLDDALNLVGDRRQRACALAALARLHLARSHFEAAAEAADRAVAELDAGDPGAGELLACRVVIGGMEPGPGETASARFAELLRTDAAPGEPRLLAQLAYAKVASGAPAAEVRELSERALTVLGADDGFYGAIIGSAVLPLIFVDELDLAGAAIDRVLDHARDAGSLIALAMASHWRAELCYRRGALADAVVWCHQTLDLCGAGWDMCGGWVVPLLAHAHIDLGEIDTAAEVMLGADAVSEQSLDHCFELAACGRLALAQGDAPAALAQLGAAGELAERHGADQPTVLPWRAWAALAALQVGERDHAVELAQTLLRQARVIGAPRALGIALHTAGRVVSGDEGLRLLAESVAALEASPATLERARALISLGARLRRSGRLAASRDPLRQGLELAETLGATPLVSRAGHELRAAGGRRRPPRQTTGPGALTPAERRVAVLAAQGLTTRQIAKSLYVTVKTVDWHLAHVYQKLDISSRHQLLPEILGDPIP